MTNRPVNFSDPTGHRPCEDIGDGSCLSERQSTARWKVDLDARRKRGKLLKLQRELTPNPDACGGANPSVVCLAPKVEDQVLSQVKQCDPILHANCLPNKGPTYSDFDPSTQWQLTGYKTTGINWRKVDWFHAVTNGAGIVGDISAGLAFVGVLPAAPVAELGTLIDGVGIGADVIDVIDNGDFSGISWDAIEYVAKESRVARIIPFIGFGLNIDGFFDAINEGSIQEPVWGPPATIGPQN